MLALTLIGWYQQKVSPYKGYCCARRMMHGGDSCSQFAKLAIAEFGLIEGILRLMDRFTECRLAAETLDYESGVARKMKSAAGRECPCDLWCHRDFNDLCGCRERTASQLASAVAGDVATSYCTKATCWMGLEGCL